MRRVARLAAGLAAALILAGGVAALLTWPESLSLEVPGVTIDVPADEWLARTEADAENVAGLIAGTEKRIVWQDVSARARTDYVVIYLHGFSATRQESSPFAERLAARLRANLFETRLAGHGLQRAVLEGVRAEDWLADGAEALAIGKQLGDRLILVGTSTGATLALALSAQPDWDATAALVLMSPNFSPRDPAARLLTAPGGPLLARVLLGETRSWTPANELQERYWATRYPTGALVEMMRLVDAVDDSLPLTVGVPLLAILSAEDSVIDVQKAEAGLRQVSAPALRVEFVGGGGPSRHVLAGDILAPHDTAPLVDLAHGFLGRHLPGIAPVTGL